MALAADERIYTGVFYKTVRPTLLDTVMATRRAVASRIDPDLNKLMEEYA